MIHTAFILGAGLGTRLRPLTEKLPKPLLPVGGMPMICHLMNRLVKAGVARFIVNTHHCAEAYAVAFPQKNWRGIPVTFVHEPVLLETGGGLKNIEPLLADDDVSIFVCNGDVFAAPDFARLAEAHNATDADATLLLRTHGGVCNVRVAADSAEQPSRLPSAATPATEIVTDMRGRLGATGGALRLFTGIYCVRRGFFSALDAGKVESVVEGFLRRIAAGTGRIRALTDDGGHWHDLGTVAEYERVAAQFAA